MTVSARLPAPNSKYGYPCEWDRWIEGRRVTFRLSIDPQWTYVGTARHKKLRVSVVVTRWDRNDLWVQDERVFKLAWTDVDGIHALLRRSRLEWVLKVNTPSDST